MNASQQIAGSHWTPKKQACWQALKQQAQTMRLEKIVDLFTKNPQRAQQFSVSCNSFLLDFSKNLINEKILNLLIELAETSELSSAMNALFSGKKINLSEQRAALHPALRASVLSPLLGHPWKEETQRLTKTVAQLRQGHWLNHKGQPILDIVNIGVGGSDLGPRFTCQALAAYANSPLRLHFVANIDPNELHALLNKLNPETTLFILCSKSFYTRETQLNAAQANQWLQQTLTQEQITHHWIAVTHCTERARAFNIPDTQIFYLPETIGGRYSIWSSMGISLMLSIGPEKFQQFLTGAEKMDQHFQQAPLRQNMPVIMALISVWYQNFLNTQAHGVIPYDHQLMSFLDYLQQLDMESNGKSCDQQGHPVSYSTGAILWGGVGSNSQHSFHQLLHQGTQLYPVDFLLPLTHPMDDLNEQHRWLVANCLAQSQALMLGQQNEHQPEKNVPGNKPSNTLCYPYLTPEILGGLIALYEHKVFTQSVIWQINPFDQWGVELGKVLCQDIFDGLSEIKNQSLDGSTEQLIQRYKKRSQN